MRARTSASHACGSMSFHFRRHDQAVHHRRPLAAAIRTGEQPRPPAQSDAAQYPFGCVAAEADASVIEEAGERVPTLEHLVHGLGEGVMARPFCAFLANPGVEVGDNRATGAAPQSMRSARTWPEPNRRTVRRRRRAASWPSGEPPSTPRTKGTCRPCWFRRSPEALTQK